MPSKTPARLGMGLLRVFLAATVAFLLVETRSQPWPVGVYPAIGLALAFSILVLTGRLRFVWKESLYRLIVDSLAISLLVGATGGEKSPFFALYLLAALGLSRVPDIVRGIVGSALLVGGYLAAVATGGDFGILSPATGFETVLLLCSCVASAALGAGLRYVGNGNQRISSALEKERRYAGRTEALLGGVGSLLETLSQEEIVRWTARVARESLGAPYAHVATLDGLLHETSAADGEAYPSWWHPEIQRLLLKSCRTGDVAHGDTLVHGMEAFVAVPLFAEDSGSLGAIILGGTKFSTEQERLLKLLAGRVAPILGRADDSHGGRDPVSGAPNRDSLLRVIRRELSRSRPLTVLVIDLGLSPRHGRSARDSLMRRTAQELQRLHQNIFHLEEDIFVTLSSGANAKKAAAVALETRRVADRLAGDSDYHESVSVGFVTTKTEQREPSLLLNAMSEALARAKSNPDRIAGGSAGAEAWGADVLLGGGEESRASREIQALAEAIEIRDPELGAHSRAVSRLAALIGSKMALSGEEMNALVTGALLHDIGKIGIADSILYKPAALSAEEYETIKRHPLLGVQILSSIPELSYMLPIVKHHHERHDGKGYPDGLRGARIHPAVRIVSVADAMDTLTRDRPYRHGRTEKEALHEILRNSGTQFDPEVVGALQEVIDPPDIRKISS